MKRYLGIARCGLACCLCTENEYCGGCHSNGCIDKDICENRKCSLERGIMHCFECDNTDCRKGLLGKPKPFAFTKFARIYGSQYLLDCLERNEKKGIVYHRCGINGDYDVFDDIERLMKYIENGD